MESVMEMQLLELSMVWGNVECIDRVGGIGGVRECYLLIITESLREERESLRPSLIQRCHLQMTPATYIHKE